MLDNLNRDDTKSEQYFSMGSLKNQRSSVGTLESHELR